MKILSVDPHARKRYAWARWEDGRLLDYGTISVMSKFGFLVSWAELVAIEDQYLAKSFKTSKEIAWAAGKVAGIAEYHHRPYMFVNVASWKSGMKLLNGSEKLTPKAKVAAMIHAAEVLVGTQGNLRGDVFKVTEDLASAILIGCYLTNNPERIEANVNTES